MKPIFFDAETYYSREFGFSTMTTEAYVRDPRFEIIGCAIKVGAGENIWYPQPEVADAIKSIDWSDAIVIGQNTQFDGAILNWRYGVNPKAWGDTLAMSRALYPHERSHSLKAQAEREQIGIKGDEVMAMIGMRYADFTPKQLADYGEYCRNDVQLTHDLFYLYMKKGFPVSELKLIDLTLRMFIDATLRLDAVALHGHLKEVRLHKSELMGTLREHIARMENPELIQAAFSGNPDDLEPYLKSILMSNPKFAELLMQFGVAPPMKTSAATGKLTYAFAKSDEAFQALAEHEDERVQALVAARLGSKSTLEETRTERFIDMSRRGVFPIPLQYYGTHTGRWSGKDSINLQNLPARPHLRYANKLKKAILPPEGHLFIDCDSAQIEARTLAWLSGQQDLVDAFAAKKDVYKQMASHIYGVRVEDIDKTQRQVGKTVILGAGYGIGHLKLRVYLQTQAGVTVSEEEAKRIITTYRSTYTQIPLLWKLGEAALQWLIDGRVEQVDYRGVIRTDPERMALTLPNGLFTPYPELRRAFVNNESKWVYTSKGSPTFIYGGKVVENFTQSVARCIIGEQMLRIARKYKPVLTVHDSIAITAPIDEADEARAYVEECMSWCPPWAKGLPLACESGMGVTYGDA